MHELQFLAAPSACPRGDCSHRTEGFRTNPKGEMPSESSFPVYAGLRSSPGNPVGAVEIKPSPLKRGEGAGSLGQDMAEPGTRLLPGPPAISTCKLKHLGPSRRNFE